MRLLLTAGPTREPLDPVRYLSNRSTGEMGFALARAALAAGHAVDLILGPVAGTPPEGANVMRVETAEEMLAACLNHLPAADAILCAAAVCDFRPRERSIQKMKRKGELSLRLVENPDIAAALGGRRGERPMAIFALETERGREHAREKMARKNADLCVLNAPEAIGAPEARFLLLRRDGSERDLGRTSKAALSEALVAEITELLQ